MRAINIIFYFSCNDRYLHNVHGYVFTSLYTVFKRYLKRIASLMPCKKKSKPEVQVENKMKACQLFGGALFDLAIFQPEKNYFINEIDFFKD